MLINTFNLTISYICDKIGQRTLTNVVNLKKMTTRYGQTLLNQLFKKTGRQSALNLLPTDEMRAQALEDTGAGNFAQVSETNGTIFLGDTNNEVVKAYLEKMGYNV
jgi:hypothetical protein